MTRRTASGILDCAIEDDGAELHAYFCFLQFFQTSHRFVQRKFFSRCNQEQPCGREGLFECLYFKVATLAGRDSFGTTIFPQNARPTRRRGWQQVSESSAAGELFGKVEQAERMPEGCRINYDSRVFLRLNRVLNMPSAPQSQTSRARSYPAEVRSPPLEQGTAINNF